MPGEGLGYKRCPQTTSTNLHVLLVPGPGWCRECRESRHNYQQTSALIPLCRCAALHTTEVSRPWQRWPGKKLPVCQCSCACGRHWWRCCCTSASSASSPRRRRSRLAPAAADSTLPLQLACVPFCRYATPRTICCVLLKRCLFCDRTERFSICTLYDRCNDPRHNHDSELS